MVTTAVPIVVYVHIRIDITVCVQLLYWLKLMVFCCVCFIVLQPTCHYWSFTTTTVWHLYNPLNKKMKNKHISILWLIILFILIWLERLKLVR
jgi:hypothetical protein